MSERVAVVVGGASGIGRAVAVGLADQGYRVVVADRNADAAAAVLADPRAANDHATDGQTAPAKTHARLVRELARRRSRVGRCRHVGV